MSDDDRHITGIVDWDSSEFLPFGWNFCLDLFLGEIDFDGGKIIFTEYEGRSELEMEFWQTFWEKAPDDMKRRRENLESAIKVSRGIGLLRRYVGLDVLRFLGGSLQMMPVIKALLYSNSRLQYSSIVEIAIGDRNIRGYRLHSNYSNYLYVSPLPFQSF